MPPVSLTTFLDFISKSGSPKFTVVRQWKYKPDYSPSTDFYKRFRETVTEIHETGQSLAVLDTMVKSLTDTKKKVNYPEVVKGYKTWCKQHQLDWFTPTTARWRHNTMEVAVNPELGLNINGVPHVIKLYLKSQQLKKSQAELACNLLALTLPKRAPKGCVVGVLDVRRGRLYTRQKPDNLLTTQLQCERDYWCRAEASI